MPLWPKTAKVLQQWRQRQAGSKAPSIFPSLRGNALTRDSVHHLLGNIVGVAMTACPSLAAKHVSPHVVRHYLPSRTISGRGAPASYFRQSARSGIDIISTPFMGLRQGEGVPHELYHRPPNRSVASAGRPAGNPHRAVCELLKAAGLSP